jgi:uncharacterized membrane protein
MKKNAIYQYLKEEDFSTISSEIGEAEKKTSGEIRVSIREKPGMLQMNKQISSIAASEFKRLKMNKTRDRTGILFFLLLSEKKFHIVADSGIHEKVGQKVWDSIRDEMQSKFREGNFCDGITLGIRRAGSVLAENFPIKHDDTNELPNDVVVR